MNNILKNAVAEYSITGNFTIAASVSADADSKKAKASKNVFLEFILQDTPLPDVIAEALRNKRITWQTSARNHFNEIATGSTIKVAFKGGQLPVSPEEAMVAKLQRMTPEEQVAYMNRLMAQAQTK